MLLEGASVIDGLGTRYSGQGLLTCKLLTCVSLRIFTHYEAWLVTDVSPVFRYIPRDTPACPRET